MAYTQERLIRADFELNMLRAHGFQDARVETESRDRNEIIVFKINIPTNERFLFRYTIDFPEESSIEPFVLVDEPNPVIDRQGDQFVSANASFHVLGLVPNRKNRLRLCVTIHDWKPNDSIYNLCVKTRLWSEAFIVHLRTGQSIQQVFNEWGV